MLGCHSSIYETLSRQSQQKKQFKGNYLGGFSCISEIRRFYILEKESQILPELKEIFLDIGYILHTYYNIVNRSYNG